MVYAMSDLHGCYELYIEMLDKIKFSHNDTLYILGDIVDRGERGLDIIRDIKKRSNVKALLGNHELVALNCFQALMGYIEVDDCNGLLRNWMDIGGASTLEEFVTVLSLSEKHEITEFIGEFDDCLDITVNGKAFFLSHTVPLRAQMVNGTYSTRDLLSGAPEYDKVYFKDKYLVTGHTPTFTIDDGFKNKIIQKNNHIAIDCGAVFCGTLGCICLDTFEEFYVSQQAEKIFFI